MEEEKIEKNSYRICTRKKHSLNITDYVLEEIDKTLKYFL